MAELRTRIVLRNDDIANWSTSSVVLLKGEIGIEFIDGGKAKIKIGDGEKAWADLDYFGGEHLVADDKSIVVDNGAIKMLGFEGAAVGAQPRKKADGTIEWVVPSTDTVEGLQTTVAGLQSDVINLQTSVTEIREIIMPSGEGATTLVDRVQSLENKVGEDTVAAQIDAKLNEFMNEISDDGTVNTLKELIDYVAAHGEEAADMAADIKTLQDLVGTTSVNDQILSIVNNLPVASSSKAGVVLGSDDADKISVAEDGTMEVNSLSTDKLVQGEDTLILDGGSASN